MAAEPARAPRPVDDVHADTARPARQVPDPASMPASERAAAFVAAAPADEAAFASTASTASTARTASADIGAARGLMFVTLGAAALVAGLLEYAGLGIAARHGGSLEPGAFWAAWANGSLRTLGAAVGAGAVAAGTVAVGRRRWRRPWRAVSAAFALGAATVCVAFALLVAWAP